MKSWAFIICMFLVIYGATAQPVSNATISINDDILSQSAGISLQGDWYFQPENTPSPSLQNVPNSWIFYTIDGSPFPSEGTGTFEITITNPDRIGELALLLYGISVEYKITANDQVIHRSKGYLPEQERSGLPARSRDLISLPDSDTINLSIEVNNDVHNDGGLTKAPVIGRMSSLRAVEMNRSNVEMVQIGCLLLMWVYNLILFFQFRNSSYLYLSMLCFTVLTRGLVVFDGSLMLYSMLPQMSYALSKKIEFFVVYSTVFVPPLFLESLFKDYRFKKIIYGLTAVGIGLMLIVLFTPTNIFTSTLNFYHLMMLPSFVVVFAIVIGAIGRKKVGARIAALGILISFGFTALEILINSGLVELYHGGPNLVNTGVVAFLFIQTIVISKVFAHYREETVRKSHELTQTEMEKKTIERELGDKDKELADFTFSMIQKNRLLDEIDDLIKEITAKKETESVTTVLNKFGRLINLNRQSSNQWDDFNRYFGNVHRDFFNTLSEKYPKLSPNDLRHCALIKMNLSLKESAEILGVDVGSVKVARYRMKRKMGLGEEEDLRQLIVSL